VIDHILVPQKSPWFEFFKIGQDVIVEQFNETKQYIDDYLGLREMYAGNKLIFGSCDCLHQDIPSEHCKPMWYDKYVKSLLNNTLP